jgi:sugar O-acyltransferase (sialic acid O-acetyltransferase NeuD family)
MKNNKLVIVGTSNNSKLAKLFFEKDTFYKVIAFSIEKEYIVDKKFEGLPIVELESLEESYPPNEFDAFVAVGYKSMNKLREKLYNIVKFKGYFLPNYISPNCRFLTKELIGDNNFILEDNTIQPFVKIGSNNVLWSGNHIGHDVCIGNHNFITSHTVISGFTIIENNAFIGVNATINDSLKISSETLIGSGAIITKSTEKSSVWVSPRSIKLDKLSNEIEL